MTDRATQAAELIAEEIVEYIGDLTYGDVLDKFAALIRASYADTDRAEQTLARVRELCQRRSIGSHYVPVASLADAVLGSGTV